MYHHHHLIMIHKMLIANLHFVVFIPHTLLQWVIWWFHYAVENVSFSGKWQCSYINLLWILSSIHLVISCYGIATLTRAFTNIEEEDSSVYRTLMVATSVGIVASAITTPLFLQGLRGGWRRYLIKKKKNGDEEDLNLNLNLKKEKDKRRFSKSEGNGDAGYNNNGEFRFLKDDSRFIGSGTVITNYHHLHEI